MKYSDISAWIQQNIPEYQYLLCGLPDRPRAQEPPSCGVNAGCCEQVAQAAAFGWEPKRIYFSAPGKTEEDLARTIGKCRFVANDWEELCRINHVSQSRVKDGFLETVGLRVVPEQYDNGNQIGIPEKKLYELAQTVKTLSAVSVRGCFIQGNITDLQGDALGKYFRACYELAKRITAVLPCSMSYLCMMGGAESAWKNAVEHPETLEEFLRHAKIVAAQNQTAFYARLLVT